MTVMPKRLSDRPETTTELLRDALASLHLSGALFLRAEFTSPWALESSNAEALAHALEPCARRVILFHVVLEGRLVVALGGVEEELGSGDVAILPCADQHVLRSREKTRAIPMARILPPRPWTRLPSLRHGGGGAATSIACGYLYSDDLHLSPALAAMPALMVVRTGGGSFAEWLMTNVRFALAEAEAREGGRDVLMQRLPEVLFLKCLDLHARHHGAQSAGWLAAAADPIVGRAMAELHRLPGQAWTLQKLSRACGASRSVLDERFHRLVGCAPMQYLTSWRLQLAARRLRSTAQSVAEIAEAIGYGSIASFSRAFKRHIGASPSEWRTLPTVPASAPAARRTT
jgi:AraC-like DNA-binding protein